MKRKTERIATAAVAGLIGGLAASWVMNQFQVGWAKAQSKLKPQQQRQESDEDATMRMANQLVAPLLGRELTKREKSIGGPIVHYAFGGTMGAVYGALGEEWPEVRAGAGSGFATALFVGADEVMVPILKLSGPPQKSPLGTHLYAWVSHLVYGATLEGVRRVAERALRGRNRSAWERLQWVGSNVLRRAA